MTHENRDPTRPANIFGFLDPTHLEPTTIYNGQRGFIIINIIITDRKAGIKITFVGLNEHLKPTYEVLIIIIIINIVISSIFYAMRTSWMQ